MIGQPTEWQHVHLPDVRRRLSSEKNAQEVAADVGGTLDVLCKIVGVQDLIELDIVGRRVIVKVDVYITD